MESVAASLPPGLTGAERDVIVRWAAANSYIRALYVFGSRARGNHRPDSDIDLAVRIIPGPNETEDGIAISLRRRWQAELQELLPHRVELQTTRPDAGEVVVWPAIEREGVTLYWREVMP